MLVVVVVLLQRKKNEINAQCLLNSKQSISLQKTKSIYIYICTKDSLHQTMHVTASYNTNPAQNLPKQDTADYSMNHNANHNANISVNSSSTRSTSQTLGQSSLPREFAFFKNDTSAKHIAKSSTWTNILPACRSPVDMQLQSAHASLALMKGTVYKNSACKDPAYKSSAVCKETVEIGKATTKAAQMQETQQQDVQQTLQQAFQHTFQTQQNQQASNSAAHSHLLPTSGRQHHIFLSSISGEPSDTCTQYVSLMCMLHYIVATVCCGAVMLNTFVERECSAYVLCHSSFVHAVGICLLACYMGWHSQQVVYIVYAQAYATLQTGSFNNTHKKIRAARAWSCFLFVVAALSCTLLFISIREEGEALKPLQVACIILFSLYLGTYSYCKMNCKEACSQKAGINRGTKLNVYSSLNIFYCFLSIAIAMMVATIPYAKQLIGAWAFVCWCSSLQCTPDAQQ